MDDHGSCVSGAPGGDKSGTGGNVPHGDAPSGEDHDHDTCGVAAAGEHAGSGQRSEARPGREPAIGVASNAVGVACAQ